MRREVVIDGEKDPDIPRVKNWYHDRVGYFFTPDYSDEERPPKSGYVFRLDLTHLKVLEVAMNEREISRAREIAYDFDGGDEEDCVSNTH